MTTQKPIKPVRIDVQAVDDEDADYGPLAKRVKPPQRTGVAEQVEKDNERIQKGHNLPARRGLRMSSDARLVEPQS